MKLIIATAMLAMIIAVGYMTFLNFNEAIKENPQFIIYNELEPMSLIGIIVLATITGILITISDGGINPRGRQP